MKRTVLSLVAVLAVSGIFAQGKSVGVSDANKETQTFTLSGKSDIFWSYRDTVLQEASSFVVGGSAFNPAAQGDHFFTGQFTLAADGSVAGGVSAHVEIANNFLDGAATNVAGNADNTRLGTNALGVSVKRANVRFADFLTEKLNLTWGIQDAKWDLRGKGNALFLDQYYSEFGIDRAITEHASGTNLIGATKVTNQPVGFVFDYTRENINLVVGLFPTVTSTTNGAGVGYGNGTHDSVYYVAPTYTIESGDMAKKVGVILCAMDAGAPAGAAVGFGGNGNYLQTLGIAASLKFTKQLEVYADLYTQSGKAITSYSNAAGANFDVKNSGQLMRLGAAYQVNDHFSADLSYLTISGNKIPATGKDTKYEGFISSQNNNEFNIVESNVWGLDVWNNYNRLAIMGTFGTMVGKASTVKGDNLMFTVKLGSFKLNENLGPSGTTLGKASDKLGTELDAGCAYWLSSQAAITVDWDYLTGADALKTFTAKKDSSTWIFLFGTKVNF